MENTSNNQDNPFARGLIRASDLPVPTPEQKAQTEEIEKQLTLLHRRANKLFDSWQGTPLSAGLRANSNFAVELTPQGLRLLDDLLAHSLLEEEGFSSEIFVNRLVADIRSILVHGTQSNWLVALRMARLGLLQEKSEE